MSFYSQGFTVFTGKWYLHQRKRLTSWTVTRTATDDTADIISQCVIVSVHVKQTNESLNDSSDMNCKFISSHPIHRHLTAILYSKWQWSDEWMMFLLTCDKKLTKSQLSPTHASTKRKITDELKHNADNRQWQIQGGRPPPIDLTNIGLVCLFLCLFGRKKVILECTQTHLFQVKIHFISGEGHSLWRLDRPPPL